MKRNQESNTKTRRKTSAKYLAGMGDSKYARKVKAGNQMYGNGARPGKGCCANSHLFGVLK